MAANRSVRPGLWGVVLCAVLVAAFLLARPRPARDSDPGPVSASPPAAASAPAPVASPAPERTPRPEVGGDPADDPSEGVFDATAMAWSNVDLAEVRAALPDNSYWERSAPTRDPELLRVREEAREYWNAQYGKVLSNTATEAEVRDYYAHRQKIGVDAIEISSYLLDQYGDVLPERDVGLLRMAVRLHYAKLEELPRELSDALRRREAHEERRREWLAQQALFADGEAAPAAEGD